jgi:hypothetical protein
MSKIKVCEFLNTSHLLSPDRGKVLKEEIERLLLDNEQVNLDFRGYEYISSSFLNESFGKLIIEKEWTLENFQEKITWKNISEDDETDFLIALNNAETRLNLIKNNIDPEKFYRTNLPTV